MAVSEMLKVLLVSHRSESAELLEALQSAGICQVLGLEEAAVSSDVGGLTASGSRPAEMEQLLSRLTRVIAFLKQYQEPARFAEAILSPRAVVDRKRYETAVSSTAVTQTAEMCDRTRAAIERLQSERDNVKNVLAQLRPWKDLETPPAQVVRLEAVACVAALVPMNRRRSVESEITASGGMLQRVGTSDSTDAYIIVCLPEKLGQVRKILRSADFQAVDLAAAPFVKTGGSGAASREATVGELIVDYNRRLEGIEADLQAEHQKARGFVERLLDLQILYDHCRNVLDRERVGGEAPATEATIIFEGWVRKADFAALENIVSNFTATSLDVIDPAEDELVPIEIENTRTIRPFEVITRLYGMPQRFEVDPTAFLAPFFAIFFGLCLTDAGYGFVILAIMMYLARKYQGDTKIMRMLAACSIFTIAAGAVTGGWFGDAVQQFFPGLEPVRERLMWFDPLERPMMFFYLSLVLGYIQIMTGLAIAFVHNLKRGCYKAAVFDQLNWLVMLNCIVLYAAARTGMIPGPVGRFFPPAALGAAGTILLFSERRGGWGTRLGMGLFNLFSTIFYLGDVLSYLRLMALGMVTAGLAMAINVIAKVVAEVPYGIGVLLMVLVLAGGHAFNLGISGLSAFVHTLRLQYVEFFPKFLVGGGRPFKPLSKQYKYVYVGAGSQTEV